MRKLLHHHSSLIAQGSVFLVPLVYLGLVFYLQPDSRLGVSDIAPWMGRSLYDDYDVTAMSLRGLNAALGRDAGRAGEPDQDLQEALDHPREAEATYFLEYPHAALLLFRLEYVFAGGQSDREVPTAVQDASYHELVRHEPGNSDEVRLWHRFRTAIRIHELAMIACLLLLMAIMRMGYLEGGRLAGPTVLLILPAALYFTLNRFDIVPALLTALSLACLGRRWLIASALCLGAATLVKVYPVLLAPLIIRFLMKDSRAALSWLAVYAGTVACFLVPTVLLCGWRATWAPYHFQLSRQPELDWTLYGRFWPTVLGGEGALASCFRLGTLLLALVMLTWNRPAELAGVLRRGMLILLVFTSLQVFYSPQWLLWLSPLLVPLAGRSKLVLALAAALDPLTYLMFPVVFDWSSANSTGVVARTLIYARAGLYAVLFGLLLIAEFGRARDKSG